MEVRYIVFTPEETRSAIIAFAQKQGHIATPNDVMAVDVAGSKEEPIATIWLQNSATAKSISVDAQGLCAALLLYCVSRPIPIPKRAEKKVELSVHGLTFVLTTDRTQGSPISASNFVTYGEIANRATLEINALREELARTIARADHAEGLIAQADERATRAEAARAKSSALLIKVALVPGIRGWLGRLLVRFQVPTY